MLPIRVIVHPTDFSENSRHAWELACSLARDYEAKLFVLHVNPPLANFTELGAVPPQPYDRKVLERQLAEIQPTSTGIEVSRVLVDGDEATEINAFAEKAHANIIVLGTHGRTGLGRLLMGSVAEEVLRRAPCPVLTVRNPMPMTCEASCEASAAV